MIENIQALAEEIEEEVIGFRRDLHKIPEIGYDLPKTAAYVEAKLREFGIESEKIRTGICGYGITADIVGDPAGKIVALRADMDALLVQEETGCQYASVHEGSMHACGHDGHTAMLLGAAKILARHRDQLKGTVRLIFQPAEEAYIPGGAADLSSQGVLEGVEGIYAMHLSPNEPTGTIAFNMETAMSALDGFVIELIGKGGHGSTPHKCIDAVTLSAQVINNIQYIVSRQSDPLETLVITIGAIQGGTQWNIIADNVIIKGTMRSFNQEVRQRALKDLENCVRCACENVGATYKMTVQNAANPLINHRSATEFLKKALEDSMGKEHVKIMSKPSMVSEDFANYLCHVPGAIMWLGCCSGEDTSYALHHPKFNMDEAALKVGVAAHVVLASRFLEENVELTFSVG